MVRNKKMNKENEFSIQAKRLMKFFESTGYSVNGFAQECNIPSTRTMTQIFTGGRPPSRKVLGKIIARFPALNHDWVILGYGEMIIPGMTNQASGNSVLKSKGAAFQQISDKQIETSFGINELARKVEQAMALNAQTTQILTNKVEQMAIAIKDGQDFIVDKEKKRDAFFQQMHANEMVKIQSLDKKRVATIERLDTERRVSREDGQSKLSEKIHKYLKESRELIFQALNKAKDEAVNESHEKYKQLGEHTINKKPKSTLL